MKRVLFFALVTWLQVGVARAELPVITHKSEPYRPLVGAADTGLHGDDVGVLLPLGFVFPYFGKNYTHVVVSSNGVVVPAVASTTTCIAGCNADTELPDTRAPDNVIAGVWDDLTLMASGQVRYLATPGSFVVEYFEVPRYDRAGTSVTFQVRLTESGTFYIHYGSIIGGTALWDFMAGFENDTGTEGAMLFDCGPIMDCDDEFPPDTLYSFGQPNLPELQVGEVTYSDLSADGLGALSFTVTAQLLNVGRSDANDFRWKAFLSKDQLVDVSGADGGADVQVAEGGPLSIPGTVITPDAGVTPVSSTAPASAPPLGAGEYFLCAFVDSTEAVLEAAEINNVSCGSAPVVVGSDLVATSISGPATLQAGAAANVAISVSHRGTSAPSGNVGFRVLLSVDNVVDGGDFVLASGSLAVGLGQTATATVIDVVPDSLPAGKYYYLLQVDPQNQQPEANEGNNVVQSTAQVTGQRPDLENVATATFDATTNVSTSVARLGEAVAVTVNVRNAGALDARNVKVAVVLSSDAVLSFLSDFQVCEEIIPLLATGTPPVEVRLRCTLPLRTPGDVALPTGTYFLFGIVDSAATVFESNELNNTKIVGPLRLLAPGPDLAVSEVSPPASAGPGERIPVDRTLRNVGNLDAPAASYRFYLSANTIVTESDVLLPIVDGAGFKDEGVVTLARGGSDSGTDIVKIPVEVGPGTYYVGCLIDSAQALSDELDRNNNALAVRTIVIAPSSLRVGTTSLPDAIRGRPYLFRLAALGETSASSWRLTEGPSWLTLGATDGLLSGVAPADGTNEVVGIGISVENAGRIATVRLAMRVLPMSGALEVTTAALPPIVNNSTNQYQLVLAAAGGVAPYTWRVIDGKLPPGLALSSNGTLFGAVRGGTIGVSSLKFEVRDAASNVATKALPVRVVAAGAIVLRTLVLPDAMVGQEYLEDIAAANQDGSMLEQPLKWTVRGALPAGLTASVGLEMLSITGRPSAPGRFVLEVSVEDGQGRVDSLQYSLEVHSERYRIRAQIPEVVRPADTIDIPLSVFPAAEVRYRIVNGTLPPGLSLEAEGALKGVIANDEAEGAWAFVLEAQDAHGATGVTPFSIRVAREVRVASGCSTSAADWSWLAFLLVFGGLMRRRIIRIRAGAAAFVLAALVSSLSFAQQYQVVGPFPQTYQPLEGATTTTAGAAISLPFTMRFFDGEINSVAMSQYGYLAVEGTTAGGVSNYGIPHTSSSLFAPVSFIAPWWDSFPSVTSPADRYRYLVKGSAPNRVAVFEWNSVPANSTANRISFQAQLYEATGRIRFSYSAALPGIVSASAGLQESLSVGVPAITCASAGNCSSGDFPAGQAIDLLLPAELSVSALSAPLLGYAAVSAPLIATIKNQGGRDAVNASVRFYLSTDSTLNTTDDTVIGTSSVSVVPSQGFAQVSSSAPLPVGLLPGSSFFLFCVVDPDGAVTESDESNNQSKPVPLTIGPPSPDLSVDSLTAPAVGAPGASFEVSRVFRNMGNAPSAAVKYSYFLSDNAAVSIADRPLTVGDLESLTAQQTSLGMETLTLPSDVLPGAYWLGVCVNYDSSTQTFGDGEITVVNNCFTRATAVYVSTGTLSIVSPPLPAVSQHAPLGFHLSAVGGDGEYVWEVSSGALPVGVSLLESGDLIGSASVAGNYAFEAKVKSNGLTATQALTLSVTAAGLPLTLVDQTLPTAELHRPYSASLVAIGGSPPYQWRAIDPEQLPLGLGIGVHGSIEGRPQLDGESAFTVEVTDSAGQTSSKEVVLKVFPSRALTIATAALSSASLGRQYAQSLVASGGTAPYSWSVVRFQELASGSTEVPGMALYNQGQPVTLPSEFGLAVANGKLEGIPARAGVFELALKVSDGAGAEDTASMLFSVRYADGFALTTIQLPDAFINQQYQAQLSHNGTADLTDVTFSLPCVQQAVRPGEFSCATQEETETLPKGLTLSAQGVIAGSPVAEVGSYNFLVKVADASGRKDVRALTIRVRNDFKVGNSGCSSSGWGGPLALLGLLVWAWRRGRAVRLVVGTGLTGVLLVGCGSADLCAARNIKCQGALSCDPGDGICKCGGRGGVVCAQGFSCDGDTNTCLSSRCVGVDCSGKPGTSCDVLDGQCKCGGTGGAVCADGVACNPNTGLCDTTSPCANVVCPHNQTCDTTTGACLCGAASCAAAQSCSVGADGQSACVADNCFGVVCTGATECDAADGLCKCNGALCLGGQACLCVGNDAGCAATARSCQLSGLCRNVTCEGGTNCDPSDGQCKCGGPGGPVCTRDQLCSLNPSPRCEGGEQCALPDGGSKVCEGGTSCDPEDGRCKCGGRGGVACASADGGVSAEICVAHATQLSCRRPCDVSNPSCASGTYCYFDSSATTAASYCASPPVDPRDEDSTCLSPTACFSVVGGPHSLHCLGLALGQTGVCRAYCNPADGAAGCIQDIPRVCSNIPLAPATTGYCRAN